MPRLLAVLLSFGVTTVLLAEEPVLRTFAGGFSTRWHTDGPHGHDQSHPCQEPRRIDYGPGSWVILGGDCDTADFERGNLDNSIGYRAGIERDFARAGILRFVGSADTSLSYSEYNISQNDLFFGAGSVSGGVDFARWGGRLGIRYGGGIFATADSRAGLQTFTEIVASIPLRSGASLRIARRMIDATHGFDSERNSLRSFIRPIKVAETSVMFVAGSGGAEQTPWEYSTSTGTTAAGGFGSDRLLGTARWYRLTAARELPWWGLEAQLTWTCTAHESIAESDFRGYPGNERSKTVDAYGILLRRGTPLGSRFSVHYGAGLEVADWRDEHHLLLDDAGNDIIGGVELGALAAAAVRMRLGTNTALEASIEQNYWSAIGLGERRWGIGFVLTR